MIQTLCDEIRMFIRKTDLGRHVRKIWPYKDICPVVDLSYRGAAFAFNFIPLEKDAYSVEVVNRANSLKFNPADPDTKRVVATGIDMTAALEVFGLEAQKMLSAVDRHLARPVGGIPGQTGKGKPASMTVGILTLPLGSNTGGILQAYALTETLRQMGHKPILINRRHPVDPAEAKAQDMGSEPLPLLAGSCKDIGNPNNRDFIKSHIIDVSRLFQSQDELRQPEVVRSFDAVVAGSDQVWRPKYARSLLKDFFLDFLPEDDRSVRRISYAASFGTPDWEFSPEQARHAANLLKRFTAVSVREDSGAALCKSRFGVQAQHVLDPTLLLPAAHYISTFALSPRTPGEGRLLNYILDADDDKTQMIQTVADRLSLTAYSAYGVPSLAPRTPGAPKPERTVERWLTSFHEASYVLTDSFHGVVFSILFNKPFIAYGNPERGMARFTSLLKMFGLEDRLVTSSAEVDLERMLEPIDWGAVNQRLQDWRSGSLKFLETALTGPVKAPAGGGQDKSRTVLAPGKAPGSTQIVSRGVSLAASGSQEYAENALKVLCTGCGVCVSESRGALKMKWSGNGFLVPSAIAGKIPAEAIRVCPFNPAPEEVVRDEDALAKIFMPETRHEDPKAGRYDGAYIGYSRKFRDSSSSGGISTYVFDALLKRGDVDCLFVVQGDDTGGFSYKLFKKGEEIRKISKTRYFPVTLEDIFAKIDAMDCRIAVSGVACFIKAVRLKQYYHPKYREKIPFTIGIVCGGLKSRYYTDFLASSAGIPGEYRQPEYRVKDADSNALDYSFSAMDENAVLHSVKMKRLGDMWGTGLFKAKACDFCTDVLTELADISLGDAWLPEYKQDGRGNSIIITRNPLADEIIQAGLMSGDLVVSEVPISQIIQSQGGGFNHKHGGLSYRVWEAEYFSDLPVPSIRKRFLQPMLPVETVVQLYRGRTRSKSLRYWAETRNAATFSKRMKPALKGLKLALQSRRAGVSDALMKWLSGKNPKMDDCPIDSKSALRWVNLKIRTDAFTLGLFRGSVEKLVGMNANK